MRNDAQEIAPRQAVSLGYWYYGKSPKNGNRDQKGKLVLASVGARVEIRNERHSPSVGTSSHCSFAKYPLRVSGIYTHLSDAYLYASVRCETILSRPKERAAVQGGLYEKYNQVFRDYRPCCGNRVFNGGLR
jgi:hypothetical protein